MASWRSMTKRTGSESASGSIRQSYGSPDPDPHLNAMDPQHRLEPKNSVFYALHKIVPKYRLKILSQSIFWFWVKNLSTSFVRWVNFLGVLFYLLILFCSVPGYEMPRSMQQGHQQQQEDIAPPGECYRTSQQCRGSASRWCRWIRILLSFWCGSGS